MLATYADLGFGTVYATPHVTVEDIDTQGETADAVRAKLLANSDTDIEIVRAGELRLSPDVNTVGDLLGNYTLGDSRYLLVDFSSGVWPFYAEDALFQVQMLGYTPILAHPERYGWSSDQRALAPDLVGRGVLLQVTLGSFVGTFGKAAQSLAIDLLKSGLVHTVATDAHGPGSRLKAAARGMDWLRQNVGEDALDTLLIDLPQRILSGEDVPVFQPATRSRLAWIFSKWVRR